MRTYWSNVRPNGKPVDPGTFCFITDLEDGSGLVATYGATEAEVLEKVAQQNANAQLAMVRRSAIAPPSAPQPAATPARATMTADERMQATLDLQNPAKSGEALIRLVTDETGVDPRQAAVQSFARLCLEWQDEHQEFYPHPGNKMLLAQSAGRKVNGKVGIITREMLTQTFQELEARGLLFAEPAPPQQQTPPVLPGESQVQREERPRGTRYATGARSTSFRAPQTAQTRTLKYTEEDIRTMSEAKMRRLLETNDPDYAAACEYHFPQQQQATA